MELGERRLGAAVLLERGEEAGPADLVRARQHVLVTHDYTYYRSGRLLGYSWRSESRRRGRESGRHYEYLSEFFEKDGRLMAVGYERMGSRDSVYAWMGAVVPYDQFRMKTHVRYSSAHPGDR